MTSTLAILLVCQLAGELVARLLRAPVPGPVLGMLLLFVVLSARPRTSAAVEHGAQFVHFLLGPATVALAVPLYQHRAEVKRALLPMAAALVAGAIVSIVSAVVIAKACGASPETLASLAPKSVTTPIAMGISEQIGGLPSLTAAFVIATGIIGAVVATPLLNLLGLRDWRGRGFGAGMAAHGLGTARAFQVHPLAGTFAGVALALNGLLTAILVPLLAGWLRGAY